MSRILYDKRCKCNEEFSITKKSKSFSRSEGKPIEYPKSSEITSKTFQIKYQNNLSAVGLAILNSFKDKYIYYAIDDIIYVLKSNVTERDNILAILYSPVIFLHNNFSVNFFDIWIREIYIDKVPKPNKFLSGNSKAIEPFSFITIKLFYKTRIPVKKQESLW